MIPLKSSKDKKNIGGKSTIKNSAKKV